MIFKAFRHWMQFCVCVFVRIIVLELFDFSILYVLKDNIWQNITGQLGYFGSCCSLLSDEALESVKVSWTFPTPFKNTFIHDASDVQKAFTL